MGGIGSKGVRENEDGSRSCVFCDIVNQAEVSERDHCRDVRGSLDHDDVTPIFYRDEQVAAFYTRSPQGQEHMLIVPLTHIGTVNDLTEDHGPLMDHMHLVGQTLLAQWRTNSGEADAVELAVEAQADDAYVFHVPPFNSINHLHLHVFSTPFLGWKGSIMYVPRSIPILNIQWCASFDQIRASL